RSAYGAADAAHWVPDLAAGWSMIAGGLVASSHRDAGRGGMLLTATGFAWFAGNFTNADVDSIAWLSAHALFLYRGPLVHLVLTFPSDAPGPPSSALPSPPATRPRPSRRSGRASG